MRPCSIFVCNTFYLARRTSGVGRTTRAAELSTTVSQGRSPGNGRPPSVTFSAAPVPLARRAALRWDTFLTIFLLRHRAGRHIARVSVPWPPLPRPEFLFHPLPRRRPRERAALGPAVEVTPGVGGVSDLGERDGEEEVRRRRRR